MKRGLAALVFIAIAAVVCTGCGSTGLVLPTPTLQCTPQPQGALCLHVIKANGKVGDVIAYLSASASPLTGKTWRLDLTWGYNGSAPTRSRRGNPPMEMFCKDSQGRTVTTGNGCDVTLGEAIASFGEFRGFRVPMASLPNPLCVREQLKENGKWVEGPAKPACTSA